MHLCGLMPQMSEASFSRSIALVELSKDTVGNQTAPFLFCCGSNNQIAAMKPRNNSATRNGHLPAGKDRFPNRDLFCFLLPRFFQQSLPVHGDRKRRITDPTVG